MSNVAILESRQGDLKEKPSFARFQAVPGVPPHFA